MPASVSSAASAAVSSPPPSDSRSSAVGAVTMLTTSISGSLIRVTPSGSSTWPAVIWVPSSAPSIDTVSCCGIDSASASISMLVRPG